MTIFLLPPSETKNSGVAKAKLNLKSLTFPELTAQRENLIDSLSSICENSPIKARTILGLSNKQDFERVRNVELKTALTGFAWQIYSGVLYDALNAQALSSAALKKLSTNVFVQSALFGLISLGDRIAPYRLSADTKLPKIGSLANVWAKPCKEIFEHQNELIVDLRSSQYVNLAPITKSLNEQVLVIKILQKMPSGPPKIISHHNKATKGRIIRQVVTGSKVPSSAEQLARVISKLGAEVELPKLKRASQPQVMNVIVKAP